jgi:phage-related protein
MTGDTSMMLIGHPRKMDVDSSGIRLGIVSATLEFVANDPRFYNASITQSSVSLSSAGGGGFCFGTGATIANFCFDTGATQTECIPVGDFGVRFVQNNGNAYTPPVFSIRGNVTNVTVQNVQSAQSWTWTGAVGGGELKADHLARTITLDGTEVYSGLSAGSEFFWIAPGETQINISVTAGTGTGFIRFRDAWF